MRIPLSSIVLVTNVSPPAIKGLSRYAVFSQTSPPDRQYSTAVPALGHVQGSKGTSGRIPFVAEASLL